MKLTTNTSFQTHAFLNLASEICVALLLLLSPCLYGQEKIDMQNGEPYGINLTDTKLISDFCQQLPNGTELSFGIIRKGILYDYGIVIESDTIKSVDSQSKVYEIGSITKVFTSTLLSMAVNDSLISLEDNISKFIDGDFAYDITFKSLANHTSGLPREPISIDSVLLSSEQPYTHYSREDLIRDLSTISEPTTKGYNYSNFGASLLGYTLEKVYGQSYDVLLHKKILDRLGMHETALNNEIISREKLVKGLHPNGSNAPNWQFDALAPAGGIVSTVTDLYTWALMYLKNQDVAYAMTELTTEELNNEFDIGLGWHIIKDSNSRWLFHNGGTGGYTSSMILDVKGERGIILLSNITTEEVEIDFDGLAIDILSTLKK